MNINSGLQFSLTLHYSVTLAPSFASAGQRGGAAPFYRGWTPAAKPYMNRYE